MKQNRRKTKWTPGKVAKLVIILVLVAAALVTVVVVLRNRVKSKFAARQEDDHLTAVVTEGEISTTITGSGTLSDDNVEEIEIPDGVELRKIYVSRGDIVAEGDLLAGVNINSVLTAMHDLTEEIEELDEDIDEAGKESVNNTIKTTVAGRVKKLYAAVGENVASVMYEHGALALLSLDGTMSVDIENDTLSVGDKVNVTVGEKSYAGTVNSVVAGHAAVSITDDGPELDAEATVLSAEGEELGRGTLYITTPLKLVGYAGTVSHVYYPENRKLNANTALFRLTDTSYTANYEALLDERADKEEELQELIRIYKEGAIYSTVSGTVKSVNAEEGSASASSSSSSASSASASVSASSPYAAYFSMMGGGASAQTSTESSADSDRQYIAVSPDRTMSLAVSVDESDILSVSVGQSASVTVDSIENETFTGVVTEIDKAGTSTSGVTVYTATVEIEKTKAMLSGMSASATIATESVENALLIPADALNKTRTGYFVYTTYDKENGGFGGMVEVTVGISNSNYVEILSGLQAGDTVCYTEKEQLGLYAMFSRMSRSMGGMGGMGGGMPGGRR